MKQIFIIIFLALLGTLQAINIAVVGTNSNNEVTSWLQTNGHSVTNFGSTLPTSLVNYNAVILLRTNGNDTIKNFVLGGGLLITEWTGADWATSTGLLDATITSGGQVGTGVPITFTTAGINAGLANNMSNPYSDAARTDHFRYFGTIGSDVEILGTRSTNVAAIVGGSSGLGSTLLLAYDWADGFSSANAYTKSLILNSLQYSNTAVPEPATWTMLGIFISMALWIRKTR